MALAVAASMLFVAPPPGAAAPTPQQDTVGLFDPDSGQWHLRGADGWATSFWFGNPGDYPMVGDWDCDGIDTPGLYRQSDGYVYLRNQNSQGIADIRFFFGNPGDIPLAGDFNGDGCATVSLYRPSEARIFIINRLGDGDAGLGSADLNYYFGNPGDTPFVGDFDGDGIDTVGLHRASTGLVYFRNSHTQGNADVSFFFGDPGDRFVAADWTGDGIDTPGLFRPSDTTLYMRYSNTEGNADATATLGARAWLPVAGDFGLPEVPINARSWTAELVATTGDVGRFNDIAIGSDGLPIISFGYALGFAYQELRVAHCDDITCSASSTTPLFGAMFESTSLATDATRPPLISFYDTSSAALGIADCTNTTCTSASMWFEWGQDESYGKYSEAALHDGTAQVTASESGLAYHLLRSDDTSQWQTHSVATLVEHSRPALDLTTNGLARIVVPGRPIGTMIDDQGRPTVLTYPTRLVLCVDEECSFGLAATPVIHEEVVSGSDIVDGSVSTRRSAHTSVVVNRDSLVTAAISWGNGPGLDVVACADPSCVSRTTSRVDTGTTTGLFVDLEITADGLPIMAYTDPTGTVKVAQCLDRACTTIDRTTIASPGPGTEVSLTIDRTGMPIVAYYDSPAGDLVVARLR